MTYTLGKVVEIAVRILTLKRRLKDLTIRIKSIRFTNVSMPRLNATFEFSRCGSGRLSGRAVTEQKRSIPNHERPCLPLVLQYQLLLLVQ